MSARARVLRLLVLVMTSALVPRAYGQLAEDPPPDRTALLLGSVKLWPLLDAGVERRSNVFQTTAADATPPQAATVWTGAPGFFAELPVSNSRVRIGYVASYRDYGIEDVEASWSHYARVDARLVFGSGAIVEVADDLQRGVLDTREFDPGGDVTFKGERFHRNVARLGLGHERDDRSFFLRYQHVANRTVGERISGLYDVAGNEVAVSGDLRRSPRTWISWEAQGSRSELERPTDSGTEFREVNGLTARVGGRGRIGPASEWSFRGGWADFKFEGATSSRYQGISLEGRWRRELAGGPAFSASLVREPYPLLGGVGDYYVSDQVLLEATTASVRRLGGGVTLAYYGNRYPELQPERKDRLLETEVWGRLRMKERLEWRIYARRSSRSSSDPALDFDDDRIGTAIRIGG
ncbi:MAG TPA: hypothetical protein VF139_08980 [Candidatus Polarisedimenticolaceae bacterium]